MKKDGVLIKSDRGIQAEEDGRYPIGEAKQVLKSSLQELGIKSTLAGCARLLKKYGDHGEWHHASSYANEVSYYDVSSVLEVFENPNKEDKLLARSSAEKTTEENVFARISWTEFEGPRTSPKRTERHYEGEAIIKGDWISFGGIRKKISGNYIYVKCSTKIG